MNLQQHIESVVASSRKAQTELANWATRCIEEMKEENGKLRRQLENTHREFKNFAYNIQGFDDERPGPLPPITAATPKVADPVKSEEEEPADAPGTLVHLNCMY